MGYQIINNGDAAVTILFDEPISEQLSRKIIGLAEKIQKQLAQQVIDLIPAYQSLTVSFSLLDSKPEIIKEHLSNILTSQDFHSDYQSELVEIPVCYENNYALDIERVSKHCGLPTEAIIEKHIAAEYLVHMLGFSPGFLYLGGLDQAIHCPRKQNPTTRVPAGSVGIGGNQTGVYPQATPGGWQIIGRTPLNVFDTSKQSPCIASPLDRIKFIPISSKQFLQILEDKNENH